MLRTINFFSNISWPFILKWNPCCNLFIYFLKDFLLPKPEIFFKYKFCRCIIHNPVNLKFTTQWLLGYTDLCIHHHYQILEHFHDISFLNWSIVYLKSCVSLSCIAMWKITCSASNFHKLKKKSKTLSFKERTWRHCLKPLLSSSFSLNLLR